MVQRFGFWGFFQAVGFGVKVEDVVVVAQDIGPRRLKFAANGGA